MRRFNTAGSCRPDEAMIQDSAGEEIPLVERDMNFWPEGPAQRGRRRGSHEANGEQGGTRRLVRYWKGIASMK
jgi:hypothetical protein